MVEFTATTSRQLVSPSQLVEHLIQFDGPPEQFLVELLTVQCEIGSAQNGAILRVAGNALEPIALYPQPAEPQAAAPAWLTQTSELAPKVLTTAQAQTFPLRASDELYGMEPSRFIHLIPIHGRGNVRGIVAFVVANVGTARLTDMRQRLELTVGLLSLYEMRLTLQQRRADIARLHSACGLISTLNEQQKFKAVAMSLCNQLASNWAADRVSFGLMQGRVVRLHATSHTEKFTRKTELVQAIEAAMEECVDQDAEVLLPAPPDSTTVARSAAQLSGKHGPSSMLCLPLRRAGKVTGALLIERPADRAFTADEIQTIRLAADLITPRLVELHERDRWIGARIAASLKETGEILVGPTHTWAKVAAIAVTAAVIFLCFAKGMDRVEASFVIEATHKHVLSAPFEGYLLAADVQPNQQVVKNETILAQIDASPLKLELADAEAQRVASIKQADIHRRDGKIGEAAVAESEADRATAKIDLLKWRIDRAAIRSPISGIILTGDWRKQLGKKIAAGDVLFEIAPLEAMRAELAIPEDRVIDVKLAQVGQLAAVAEPTKYLDFKIDRLDPVADLVDQQNVFRARAQFAGTPPDWLRPGMQGVAKIDIERRSYAWIWSRDVVNWVRMKLWI